MGAISDILMEDIAEWPIDSVIALRTVRAFNKLLWIQNDFVNRHYQAPRDARERTTRSEPP
jgi:hypothetical protein